MNEWKAMIVRQMLAHETSSKEKLSGAVLMHRSGDTMAITIDAGGLKALLEYYSTQNPETAPAMNSARYCGQRKDNGEWVEGYYVFDETDLIVKSLSYKITDSGKLMLENVYPVYHESVHRVEHDKQDLIVPNISYISVWDGGHEVKSFCTVNFTTHEVLDIQPAQISEYELAELEVLDREYVVLNDEQRDVYEDGRGRRFYFD